MENVRSYLDHFEHYKLFSKNLELSGLCILLNSSTLSNIPNHSRSFWHGVEHYLTCWKHFRLFENILETFGLFSKISNHTRKIWNTETFLIILYSRYLPNSLLVYPFYCSLNFKDIMVSTAKIQSPKSPVHTMLDMQLGLEYSGVTEDGRRVMGTMPTEGLSLKIRTDRSFTWEVPDSWSLEEAATVPIVYSTVSFARLNSKHPCSICMAFLFKLVSSNS